MPWGGSRGGTAPRCCGALLPLPVCAWIPHTPLPLQPPGGKLRQRHPAHPRWLQLCCPSQQEALVELLGMAWSLVEKASPAGHLIPGCARMGTHSSLPRNGDDGCGTGIPRLSWPPSEVTRPPRFSRPRRWVWEGGTPIPSHPIPSHPSQPIPAQPGCLQAPAAALSRRWPQQGRIPGSPAGMCRGVPAPRPPGPLPLSALFKRLPARPARPGHGAHGGDRDLCGHRPARTPPHAGVPRLRRRLHLPPQRRADRHLPQIG